MNLVWYAMSDSTHIPIKEFKMPDGFLKLLVENEIDWGWAFQNYHVLDLTDLKYNLHVVRINAGRLETELRRRIKAMTFDIELFIEYCENGRYNIKFKTVEEKNDDKKTDKEVEKTDDGKTEIKTEETVKEQEPTTTEPNKSKTNNRRR